MFGGSKAPTGWLLCAGQILSISEYQTLYQLIGTTYGGDGQVTFGLPDMRGRSPVHVSSTTPYGQQQGVENVTLAIAQLPQHTHAFQCSKQPGNSGLPGAAFPAGCKTNPATQKPVDNLYFSTTGSAPGDQMASTLISASGSGQPHNNLQPFQVINFIIAFDGIYPSQS